MNKKLLVIGITTTVLAAGIFLAINDEKPMDINSAQNQSTQNDTTESSTTPVPTTSDGEYLEYSEEALAQTDGTRLLFFHAPWCPQCRELESSIKSGQIPTDVTIFKVDYDTNQALRQKYGVTIQTTIVRLDENGNEAEKYVAYDDPSLQNIVNNLL